MRIGKISICFLIAISFLVLTDCGGGESVKSGACRVSPAGPIPAGSEMVWRVECAAPKGGVAPGGSFLLMFPPAYYVARPANTRPQIADLKAPGYARASVDGDNGKLEILETPSYPVILKLPAGKRGWKSGRKIAFVIGETEDGKPTFRAPTFSAVSFPPIVLVDAKGEGSYRRVPIEDSVSVEPGAARTGEIVAPSVVKRGEEFKITVRFRDEFGNIAKPDAPAAVTLRDENCESAEGNLEGRAANPSCTGYRAPDAQSASGWARIKGGSFTDAGYHYLSADFGGGLSAAVSNPIYVTDESNPRRIYFGDVHGHTDYSDGLGAPADYYATAAGPAALSFAAATDVEWQLDEAKWSRLRLLCEEQKTSGEFVPLLGLEYPVAGRAVVLYDNCRASPNIRVTGSIEPWETEINGTLPPPNPELPGGFADKAGIADALPKTGAAYIPVSPASPAIGGDWDAQPLGRTANAEIFSSSGDSEMPGAARSVEPFEERGSIVSALSRGFRFGFIASSDSRDGKPGLSSTGPFPGGLTAVETGALTRRTIFDAIAGGRAYATTGARIILRADIDGRAPGRAFTPQGVPVFHYEAAGTAPIQLVELVKDGEAAWASTPTPAGKITAGQWTDVAFNAPAVYYLRVTQSDGEVAWSSPFYVDHPEYARISTLQARNDQDRLVVRWDAEAGKGTDRFLLYKRLGNDGGGALEGYTPINTVFPAGPVEFHDEAPGGLGVAAYYFLLERNREGDRLIGPVASPPKLSAKRIDGRSWKLGYFAPEAGQASLEIYDGAGRILNSIDMGEKKPGYHEWTWDGKDAGGKYVLGICYYRARVADQPGPRLPIFDAGSVEPRPDRTQGNL